MCPKMTDAWRLLLNSLSFTEEAQTDLVWQRFLWLKPSPCLGSAWHRPVLPCCPWCSSAQEMEPALFAHWEEHCSSWCSLHSCECPPGLTWNCSYRAQVGEEKIINLLQRQPWKLLERSALGSLDGALGRKKSAQEDVEMDPSCKE